MKQVLLAGVVLTAIAGVFALSFFLSNCFPRTEKFSETGKHYGSLRWESRMIDAQTKNGQHERL